ncbi:hypothetical protein MRX96_006482 [Rhipicephalus microplus]
MTPTASGGVAMSATLKRKQPQKQPQEMKKPTYSRFLKAYFRRHSLDMRARWTDADSPTSMRQFLLAGSKHRRVE